MPDCKSTFPPSARCSQARYGTIPPAAASPGNDHHACSGSAPQPRHSGEPCCSRCRGGRSAPTGSQLERQRPVLAAMIPTRHVITRLDAGLTCRWESSRRLATQSAPCGMLATCNAVRHLCLTAAGAWGAAGHQLGDAAARLQEAAQRGEGRQGPRRRRGGGALADHDVQSVCAAQSAPSNITAVALRHNQCRKFCAAAKRRMMSNLSARLETHRVATLCTASH